MPLEKLYKSADKLSVCCSLQTSLKPNWSQTHPPIVEHTSLLKNANWRALFKSLKAPTKCESHGICGRLPGSCRQCLCQAGVGGNRGPRPSSVRVCRSGDIFKELRFWTTGRSSEKVGDSSGWDVLQGKRETREPRNWWVPGDLPGQHGGVLSGLPRILADLPAWVGGGARDCHLGEFESWRTWSILLLGGVGRPRRTNQVGIKGKQGSHNLGFTETPS